MEIMIWIGAALTVLGVVGLVWCIALALRIRRSGMDDRAMRAALQKMVALNMAGLGVSAMGLILVVAGILLT